MIKESDLVDKKELLGQNDLIQPKMAGLFMVISSIVGVIFITIFIIKVYKIEDILPITLLSIFLYGIATIQFYAGVKAIKKGASEAYLKILKKNFIFVSIIIVLIIILMYPISSILFVKEASIVVNSEKEIRLVTINGTHFMLLDNESLKLTSNSTNYYYVRESKSRDSTESFKIIYEWNILNPGHGKIKSFEVLN